MNWAGGQRYTPELLDAQGQIMFDTMGDLILDETQTYTGQMKDYFRWDLKVGYRMNLGRTTHEFAFECQNLTNRKNEYSRQYNSVTGEMVTNLQTGFMPMAFYRIYF